MKTAVRMLLIIFGVALIIVGVIMATVLAQDARARLARANSLAPVTAAEVRLAGSNRTVLVEGVLSTRNPVLVHNFVAFTRYEYLGEDDDGSDQWDVVERITPPLLIEASGLVQLAAQPYRITGYHAYWQEPTLRSRTFSQEGSHRYEGLVPGEMVMTIGTVVRGNEGNEVAAEFVYPGSRDAYVLAQSRAARWLPVAGFSAGLTGLVLLVLGSGLVQRLFAIRESEFLVR
ncbi:hypothetical protein [Candidatus Chloroploca asiatica]|uniref:Uncharacterized protein n=1 Tax=Candidatus Chloroploca asiatica TaxID=1506545 RepID=A0A2H3KKJ3_9CHLR|nr:hypothetical protein [Candidatus Chloroploca asiatica]PDV98502.1 hypothetical protein A9Q02_15030 [Candidatus Chloroploca asiatica]